MFNFNILDNIDKKWNVTVEKKEPKQERRTATNGLGFIERDPQNEPAEQVLEKDEMLPAMVQERNDSDFDYVKEEKQKLKDALFQLKVCFKLKIF